MAELTPQRIVAELDRFIVGQTDAKRSLAVALRNRERRRALPAHLQSEIVPKNVLIAGPSGVGKTELSRRVAALADAPFLKTEATKFTQVGYVGRDVDSMVRELAEASVRMVHRQRLEAVRVQAEQAADERIVALLLGDSEGEGEEMEERRKHRRRKRSRLVRQLADMELEERIVEIEVEDEAPTSIVEFSSAADAEDLQEQFQEFISQVSAPRRRVRRVPVREARRILTEVEAARLVDLDDVVETALQRVQSDGVIFIDEIDKIVGRGGEYGPDVSGEGVQRDLLPIVEGAVVATRYGAVHTDHILFIAAGAFSRSRPADLLPELQGRFPLRVEVKDLEEDDFYRILTATENALVEQYSALLRTEGVTLEFTEDGLRAIAAAAVILNRQADNLGARRLFGVVEKVLEDVSFRASELAGQTVKVDAAYVEEQLATLPRDRDLSRYIL